MVDIYLLVNYYSVLGRSITHYSCFSSLFLTKVKVSKNVLGVIRKSALSCCLMARSFLLCAYVEIMILLGKRSKPAKTVSVN